MILEDLLTLAMLILLQAVLGFDNLLYISLESKRAPAEVQSRVRTLGIGIAVGLRIVLLFLLVNLVQYLKEPLFKLHNDFVHGDFNVHAIIVLFGGGFIIYTAIKEIFHMMHIEEGHGEERKSASAAKVISMIVLMNLVFSFDSILSAMALAKKETADGETTYTMWVMIVAIVVSGALMILLADKVSEFLHKNRMYEVLGLFILFVVGIMLVTEGGHLAHLKFFGNEITPMTKTTFYFVIAVLVLADIVQGRYQKKLIALKARHAAKFSEVKTV
ncbi:MAG: tellurium resistance protein TerC [Verrucomicrobiota bacterium]